MLPRSPSAGVLSPYRYISVFQISQRGKTMRFLTKCLLFSLFLIAPMLLPAQDSGASTAGQSSGSATKEEVEALRKEVASQRQTIEELKAMVQQLVQTRAQSASADGVHVVNATLVETAGQAAKSDQKPADKPSTPAPAAGWNGEHFFIKSGDFQLQPYGYFQTDYRAYNGDGVPADSFVIRRARFGFQGNYGKYYDFGLLIDAAASNGITLRDLYVNIKPFPEFQVTVGQFKEPFAQELLEGVTNIDFIERSMASLLYPSAATAFRSPGAAVHGDIAGGIMQYWVGAFNGKGILTNNTTNEPEVIGRVRFYPWKKTKNGVFQGLAFGGSIGHGRTRGLSSEQSFSTALPDAAFTLLPTFTINGPVERYNGEGTWTHGPFAIRAEYDQLRQFRRGVGTEDFGGIGFANLPAIVGKAGYAQATYVLTGESKPENGTPKVKHPVLGPETGGASRGWGAWEVAFRYDKLQVKEPGAALIGVFTPFTPAAVPTFEGHADGWTTGVNWYLNYWIKYQANFEVDRLRQPSTTGALPQNYFVVLQRLQFRF
jgi:phosphate-selective porin OprO/OprP